MNSNKDKSLTPSEEEVQEHSPVPITPHRATDACVSEVASGSPVSTLSNASENKPEGADLRASAGEESSVEAESGSSAAINSNINIAVKENANKESFPGNAGEDARADEACGQTVQTSVEFNACAASPGENERIAGSQPEPPSAVSADPINLKPSVEVGASADSQSLNSKENKIMSANNDKNDGSGNAENEAEGTALISENTETTALASTGTRSGAEPYSESNCWYITVPECESATISAVLGADDLGSLSVGPLSLVLGPRGQYGGGT